MEQLQIIKDKIKKVKEKVTEIQKQAEVELRAELTTALNFLFETYPVLKQIHFTAYTPYFNDGDECTYECYADYCGFNGWEQDGDNESSATEYFNFEAGENIFKNWKPTKYIREPNPAYHPINNKWIGKELWKEVLNENYNPENGKIVKDVREILSAIPNDVWKSVVGDHCMVLITKDGIETSKYSHD
jgi:hypothetical protein